MPSPPQFAGPPITNIPNTATAPNPATGKKDIVWFARDHDQPLFAFAGIWTPWSGTRGTNKDPVEGNHTIYGFLTCEPHGVVGPIHPKAMPVWLIQRSSICSRWPCWAPKGISDNAPLRRHPRALTKSVHRLI